MQTYCTQNQLAFEAFAGRKFVGAFDGGAIMSNGGGSPGFQSPLCFEALVATSEIHPIVPIDQITPWKHATLAPVPSLP